MMEGRRAVRRWAWVLFVVAWSGCGGSSDAFHVVPGGGDGPSDAVAGDTGDTGGPGPSDLAPSSEVGGEVDASGCPDPTAGCATCKDDADCEGRLEGLGPCERARCDEVTRFCEVAAAPEGTSCDDGDPCNGEERCRTTDDGLDCAAEAPLDCDDGDACTADGCDPGVGCSHEALACDDGDPCTIDACEPAAGCVSTPLPPCEGDDCPEGTEACWPCAATGDCPTGSPCEEPDDCESGHCENGICCPEGARCCASASDCPAPPAVCDDAASCQGRRFAGACEAHVCEVVESADDSACDASVVAVICGPELTLTCTGEADQSTPGPCPYLCETDADCDDGNPCTEDRCQPLAGCESTPLPAGTPCVQGAGIGRCVVEGELVRCDDSEICDDGADNDGDGLADCVDPDCVGEWYCHIEICGDGADNDDDGLTDCGDPDCTLDPACLVERCGDGFDNDDDGLTDCDDPDCEGDAACVRELCDDGVDNDDDLLADCFDDDCLFDPWCDRSCEADQTVDCDVTLTVSTAAESDEVRFYPGCTTRELGAGEWIGALTPPANTRLRVRATGASADVDVLVLRDRCDAYACVAWGDAETEFEVAAGHTYYVVVDAAEGVADEVELTVHCGLRETECTGGTDDDGDGLVDCDDPDCEGTPPCAEDCDDGEDNDGDFLTDCDDPDCEADPACTCRPTDDLACDQIARETTFLGEPQVDVYGCTSWSETGNERIFAFTPEADGDVELRLVAENEALDLFVLEDVCRPDRCVAFDDASISLAVEGGRTYYVSVDGFDGAFGDFALVADCGGLRETACENGADDDLDGLVDCFDTDCVAVSACRSACDDLTVRIVCGAAVTGSNEGKADERDSYSCGCAYEGLEWGGEVVYRFDATRDEVVEIALASAGIDHDVFVLSGGCDPSIVGLCTTCGDQSTSFLAVGGGTYYVVVDGFMGAAGSYELSLTCEETVTEQDCGDAIDDDGDGSTDCEDTDCDRDSVCAGETATPDELAVCGAVIVDTTVGQAREMTRYEPCTAEWLAGGEKIYALVPPADGSLTATVVAADPFVELDVLILSGGCAAGHCASYGDVEATAAVQAGELVYVVVDGRWGEGDFTLTLECGE